MFKKIIIFSFLLFVSGFHSVFAEIINPDNSQRGWQDNRAYRPSPILFLHGFAEGSPDTWKDNKIDDFFYRFYSKYYTGYDSNPTVLSATRYPYLELMDFGSSLIDRNSSIDTYKSRDRYVLSRQRIPGDPGWADKLSIAVNDLMSAYKNRDGSSPKVILVGYSMGGLAARNYLKDYSQANQNVKKLIMIATPNLGVSLAEQAMSYSRTRRAPWYCLFSGIYPTFVAGADKILELSKYIDIDGDAIWDMDNSVNGSGFLSNLNNNYSESVDHFVIAGNSELDFNKGDTVVTLNSQLGVGVLLLKNKVVIPANHDTELSVSIQGDNPLLKFLDSDKPEFELTSPAPGSTTNITTNSFSITGKVYKEYLPADSMLIVDITKQDAGSRLPGREFLLKPSDLWQPNNPDSPVAEISETISLLDQGTYKISCYIKNPAGLVSDAKEFWVKVVDPLAKANIIVHAHNPEGKEICSIKGLNVSYVQIYADGNIVGYGDGSPDGGNQRQTENKLIRVPASTRTLRAVFNGMALQQEVSLVPDETRQITFVFRRTEFDIAGWITGLGLKGTATSAWSGTVYSVAGAATLEGDSKKWGINNNIIITAGGLALGDPERGTALNWDATISFSLTGGSFSLASSVNAGMTGEGTVSTGTTFHMEDWVPVGSFVPVTAEFSRWCIQYAATGFYPAIALSERPSDTWENIIYSNNDLYQPCWLATNTNYGYALITAASNFSLTLILRPNTPNLTPTSGSRSGTLNIKMSSVPYDLIGDAI